jgi:hypothetical protein
MTLVELQRRMLADVCRPLTASMEMQQKTAEGDSVAAIAETYIKPNDRLSSFDRLEIYNHQYWLRVISAVAEDYPAMQAVMGQEAFDAMVLGYLKQQPSTSWTLRDLGGRLPAWLEAQSELGGKDHALLADVAKLELAYIDAYDRAALTPLAEEDFPHLAGDSVLMLQPHLQLLELQHPVDELVLAVHRNAAEREMVSNAATGRRQANHVELPEMRPAAIYLAVHRFEESVYYRRVGREAFVMLSALKAGRALGEAIEMAFGARAVSEEERVTVIRDCFAHAAELGWFCRSDGA